MGILGGGYYLHNITLPIMKNNKYQENNVRDLFWGYFFAFLSYIFCGLLGYFGFTGYYFQSEGYSEIEQNCILMFDIKDPLAIIIRLLLLFHIFIANALLFACQRAQILLLFTGKQETKSYKINLSLNTLILIMPFCLAVWYPEVGVLAGYLGSCSALFCIFILPICTYLKHRYTEVKNPLLAKALLENEY